MAEQHDPFAPSGRWWLQPLKAVLIGLAAGLLLSAAIDQLPERQAYTAIFVVLGICMLVCVAMLLDLKREERAFREHLEQLRREHGLEPE